jgi:hypothetical protein
MMYYLYITLDSHEVNILVIVQFSSDLLPCLKNLVLCAKYRSDGETNLYSVARAKTTPNCLKIHYWEIDLPCWIIGCRRNKTWGIKLFAGVLSWSNARSTCMGLLKWLGGLNEDWCAVRTRFRLNRLLNSLWSQVDFLPQTARSLSYPNV